MNKQICFICAQEFESYKAYKQHIIDSHILNQEYIICPKCEFPIRDVRLHYKIKHKNDPVPNLPLMKALVWYDWSYKYQKMLRKKKKWKEGFYHSTIMNKDIHYRSSWERDVMICLDKCEDIEEFHGDDFICIEYPYGDGIHKYWPDFYVKLKNNDIYILEIKPKNQTEMSMNLAKWKSALQYCKLRQWKFQVWTEQHIRKVKMRSIRNEKLLLEQVFPNLEDNIDGENNNVQENI